MRKLMMTLLALMAAVAVRAQSVQQDHTQSAQQDYKMLLQRNQHQAPFSVKDKAVKAVKRVRKAASDDEVEFIFSPDGEEKMYVMSLYSYDQTNAKFVRAQSLKSQVRYAADGKTVYLKDLTRSLNAITWVKGERRTMQKDSLEVGIRKGDEVIDVPYGQPLVYYKSRYLVFFCPMKYQDSTGEMEAQDNYTLIVRGDSLVQPTYPEGTFQAAAGYVYVNDKTQGSLSLDIDHGMRLEKRPFVEAPSEVAPVDYVYSFVNSYGNIYKKKAQVKRQGNDLYMQLSTSAPDAYVKGSIRDGRIEMESPQLITDSTFVYYYSLADPVYEGGTLADFLPTSETRLQWDEATRSITSVPAAEAKDVVFSVDYLDGMEMCMDYVNNPELTVYPGDKAATPADPIWRSVNLEGDVSSVMTYNYMSFVIPALDADSCYINPDLMTYRIYVNDELYKFTPEVYRNLSTAMTDVPYSFADGFDFYTYDQLHYIYLYFTQDEIKSLGIQSVYTVEGEERVSNIVTQRFDVPQDPDDDRLDNDLALNGLRAVDVLVKAGEQLKVRGTVANKGKNAAKGFRLTLTTDGKTTEKTFDTTLAAGKSAMFEVPVEVPAEQAKGTVDVLLTWLDGTTDDQTADNAASVAYGLYEKNFTQPIALVEEFTAESCGWCPYGAYRLHTAIEEGGLQDRVVWMCHHEGYGVDWLTVDASTDYTALYGGNTFAPAWMVNRNQKFSDEDYAVFGIGEIDEVKSTMQSALCDPCFVKVEADNRYSKGNLRISVELQRDELFKVQCPEPRLTVFVVEDSIPSKKQKSYDSHSIPYHHNALRAVLTEVWGDIIQWQGNEAEKSYTFTVPNDFVANNLRVIAFVHEGGEDVNLRRVYNTALSRVSDPTGIDVTTAQTSSSTLFNLQGQRVSPSYRGIVIRDGRKTYR